MASAENGNCPRSEAFMVRGKTRDFLASLLVNFKMLGVSIQLEAVKFYVLVDNNCS